MHEEHEDEEKPNETKPDENETESRCDAPEALTCDVSTADENGDFPPFAE